MIFLVLLRLKYRYETYDSFNSANTSSNFFIGVIDWSSGIGLLIAVLGVDGEVIIGFESTEDGVEDDVVDERDLGVTKATSGSCCLGEICTISIDSPLGFISGSFSVGFDDVMFMFVSSRKSIFGFLFLFLFFLFFVFSLSVLTVKPFDLI